LEEYVKEILYVYPLLVTVEKDYEEHIKNRALLSYKSGMTAERLVEYLAEEIVWKENLTALKAGVERVMDKLSQTEKALLEIRYFGRKRKEKILKTEAGQAWSRRKYFRMQDKLEERLDGLFIKEGLTKETYIQSWAESEPFKAVRKRLQKRERQKREALTGAGTR